MHTGILAIHVGMGTLGVLTGAAALLFRKGSRAHRVVGTVFVLSMLFMGASASILAVMTSQPGLVIGGLMTMYFIATAWMAGRRKDGETGAFEIGALSAAVVIGLGAIAQYSFNGIMALAAVADLSVILRRGLSGAQRIARHLWRMCLGLFIAVGSFAAQGAKFLPPGVGLRVLLASMILIFVVMFYWLVRVLFTSWYRQAEQARPRFFARVNGAMD